MWKEENMGGNPISGTTITVTGVSGVSINQCLCDDDEYNEEHDEHEDNDNIHNIINNTRDRDYLGLVQLQPETLPRDHFNVVFLLFYLYGIASMAPWNFFIMANDYWMYKFRDVTPHNATIQLGKTQFQAEFTSYLNVAASVPSTICLILNSFYSHLIPLSIRMGGSLILITIFFTLTTVMVQIDTDDWQDEFFILTIVTVVIVNGAGAVFGGSLIGIAGKFSCYYISAVINGQALGGILAAVTQILSLTFKVSPVHSAFIYFVIGDAIIIASLVSFILLYKVDFFLFYTFGPPRETAISTNNRVTYVSNIQVIKKIWIYIVSVFLVFMFTTSVYPGITVLVESHHSGAGGDWNNIYFVPVVNYLIFNCGDFTGRLVAGILLKPKKNASIVGIVSVVRIITIPLLMMCNAHPRSHLPVIINSDWEYIILMVFFSVSNGYLANISMINAAGIVDHHERERASSIMATVLGIGVTIGAMVGMALVRSL